MCYCQKSFEDCSGCDAAVMRMLGYNGYPLASDSYADFVTSDPRNPVASPQPQPHCAAGKVGLEEGSDLMKEKALYIHGEQ